MVPYLGQLEAEYLDLQVPVLEELEHSARRAFLHLHQPIFLKSLQYLVLVELAVEHSYPCVFLCFH